MSLSERAASLEKSAGVALVILPKPMRGLIVELLALVRDLAAAIEKKGE